MAETELPDRKARISRLQMIESQVIRPMLGDLGTRARSRGLAGVVEVYPDVDDECTSLVLTLSHNLSGLKLVVVIGGGLSDGQVRENFAETWDQFVGKCLEKLQPVDDSYKWN
jgi:hypothetical protein